MPNGDLLVARANELTKVSRNGGNQTFATVGDPSTSSYWLRWSPDGKVLRFTVSGLNGYRIGEISSSGSNYHFLFPEGSRSDDVLQGNWTPDGTFYLFEVDHNSRADIWAIREKGDMLHKISSMPVQLTSGPLSFHSPQPSVDGKKIFVIGEQQRAELTRYDAKSGQFVPFLGAISAREVSFSRDGQWVGYVTFPKGELWRCRLDGTEKLQLTSAPFLVGAATVSPDGKEIAFSGNEPGLPEELYTVKTEGGTPQKISIGEYNVSRLSWAPDRGSIVFGDASSPSDSVNRSIDLRTQKVVTLPDSPDGQKLSSAVYSPQGDHLSASTQDGKKLMIFDFLTNKWSELASTEVGAHLWSRDGQYIYFDNGSSLDPAIYRVRVADHKIELVCRLKGFRRALRYWRAWMGLTPDDAPLLMRDTGSEEVYALDFHVP